MAKIIEATRPTTAQRIARERTTIADLERQIGELREVRARKLVDDDDDPGAVLEIDKRLAEVERQLRVCRDRLPALEAKLAQEQMADRERRKLEALAAFEQRLAGRVAAAERVEKALREFGDSLRGYEAACRAPYDGWPHDLFPPLQRYGQFARSNLLERVAAALDMKPAAARVRLSEIDQRVGQIVDHDAAFTARLVDDIRDADLPDRVEKDIAA